MSSRRKLHFNSVEELLIEIDRLQRAGYKRLGNWSLPMACRHLASVIETNLFPPPSDVPTADETAKKNGFFAMVFGPGGMPTNIPLPPESVPPPDSSEQEISRFKVALQSLDEYPHACVKVGGCGPVPIDEVRKLHMVHAAHHLSFLVPTDVRRSISYANVQELIGDLQLLRKGYIRSGNWTLFQTCRHLAMSITSSMKPAIAPATPEQQQVRPLFEQVLKSGKIPSGIESAVNALPPADCTDADIDQLIEVLHRFEDYTEPTATHGRFGPLNLMDYRKIVLIHAAHHLSYLIPTDN